MATRMVASKQRKCILMVLESEVHDHDTSGFSVGGILIPSSQTVLHLLIIRGGEP